MATKLAFLPLFILHQNNIYRNSILAIDKNDITISPFEQECEATKFVSGAIIVANKNVLNHLSKMPIISRGFVNIKSALDYLHHNNLFLLNNEEPTLICADSSGYRIL